MGAPTTSRTLQVADHLWATIELMAAEMQMSPEALVNQALFSWAKMNGYLEPSPVDLEGEANAIAAAPVSVDREPSSIAVEAVPAAPEAPTTAPAVEARAPQAPAAAPVLRPVVLIYKGQEHRVGVPRFVIGRDRSCDLPVDSALISRNHAAIHVGPERVEVEDLGSSNGTWFDSERIKRREVTSGDVFVFGDVSVRIELR
jgi:stage V sporulation protein SpoVS